MYTNIYMCTYNIYTYILYAFSYPIVIKFSECNMYIDRKVVFFTKPLFCRHIYIYIYIYIYI